LGVRNSQGRRFPARRLAPDALPSVSHAVASRSISPAGAVCSPRIFRPNAPTPRLQRMTTTFIKGRLMRHLLIAAILCLSAASVAPAQARTDSIEVMTAVLSRHAGTDSTRARIGVKSMGTPINITNTRAALTVSSRSKLRMVELTDSIPMVCQTRFNPRRIASEEICKFRDYDTMVELWRPVFKENSATIRLEVENNSTHPIASTGTSFRLDEYHLERRNGRWVVVSVKVLVMS
jgi:hypothetical protein